MTRVSFVFTLFSRPVGYRSFFSFDAPGLEAYLKRHLHMD